MMRRWLSIRMVKCWLLESLFAYIRKAIILEKVPKVVLIEIPLLVAFF